MLRSLKLLCCWFPGGVTKANFPQTSLVGQELDLLQVDLTSFLVNRARILGREAAKRATKSSSAIFNRTKDVGKSRQERVSVDWFCA